MRFFYAYEMRATFLIPFLFGVACTSPSDDSPPTNANIAGSNAENAEGADSNPAEPSADGAHVQAVSATGADGAYTFSVTLLSNDAGCKHYADWWELLDASGAFIYRRILNHSHVDEQPFTRSGDPVDISGSTQLIVRGHMNDSGYGGTAYSGTVASGFVEAPHVDATFAAAVENEGEQPEDCWY